MLTRPRPDGVLQLGAKRHLSVHRGILGDALVGASHCVATVVQFLLFFGLRLQASIVVLYAGVVDQLQRRGYLVGAVQSFCVWEEFASTNMDRVYIVQYYAKLLARRAVRCVAYSVLLHGPGGASSNGSVWVPCAQVVEAKSRERRLGAVQAVCNRQRAGLEEARLEECNITAEDAHLHHKHMCLRGAVWHDDVDARSVVAVEALPLLVNRCGRLR